MDYSSNSKGRAEAQKLSPRWGMLKAKESDQIPGVKAVCPCHRPVLPGLYCMGRGGGRGNNRAGTEALAHLSFQGLSRLREERKT